MTKEEWRELGVEEDECYLVRAIRDHLLTPEQRLLMFECDFSIEDVLNGRVEGETNQQYSAELLKAWNQKLGWKAFGF